MIFFMLMGVGSLPAELIANKNYQNFMQNLESNEKRDRLNDIILNHSAPETNFDTVFQYLNNKTFHKKSGDILDAFIVLFEGMENIKWFPFCLIHSALWEELNNCRMRDVFSKQKDRIYRMYQLIAERKTLENVFVDLRSFAHQIALDYLGPRWEEIHGQFPTIDPFNLYWTFIPQIATFVRNGNIIEALAQDGIELSPDRMKFWLEMVLTKNIRRPLEGILTHFINWTTVSRANPQIIDPLFDPCLEMLTHRNWDYVKIEVRDVGRVLQHELEPYFSTQLEALKKQLSESREETGIGIEEKHKKERDINLRLERVQQILDGMHDTVFHDPLTDDESSSDDEDSSPHQDPEEAMRQETLFFANLASAIFTQKKKEEESKKVFGELEALIHQHADEVPEQVILNGREAPATILKGESQTLDEQIKMLVEIGGYTKWEALRILQNLVEGISPVQD